MMDVGLKSMVFLCKYAIPEMAASGGGSVINISSIDGMRAGSSRNVPYGITKGGIITLTRLAAVHHGRENVRVNSIAPGHLHTTFVGQDSPGIARAPPQDRAARHRGQCMGYCLGSGVFG